MPSPDAKLEILVQELGTINVRSLVKYIISVHPNQCPHELALRTLHVLQHAPQYVLSWSGEDLES